MDGHVYRETDRTDRPYTTVSYDYALTHGWLIIPLNTLQFSVDKLPVNLDKV